MSFQGTRAANASPSYQRPAKDALGRSPSMRVALMTLVAATSLHAQSALAQSAVSDPVGDFVPSFTGPRNGDLDVTRVQSTYDGTTFRLDATVNGTIGTTAASMYVWGFNRGRGTPNFAAIGATGVLFDSVVIVNTAARTVTVRDLLSGVSTVLPTSAVTINGNQISVTIPANLLTPQGFATARFLTNLWPRGGVGGNEVISDFAPNNSSLGLTLAFPVPVEASVQTELAIDDAGDRFDLAQRRLAVRRLGSGGRLGGYLSGRARFGNRGLGASLATDVDSTAIEGGLDYAIGDNFIVGAGFGTAKSTARLSNGGSIRARIDTPSVYLGIMAGQLRIDAYAAYSEIYYTSTRILPIGTALLTASSSPRGRAYSGGIAAGYDLPIGNVTLTPLASALFTRVRVNSYTEANPQDFGAVVNRRERDSVRLSLGGQLRYAEERGWGSFALHLRGLVVQELADKNDAINFAFTAQTETPLSLIGPRTGVTYGAFDVGVGLATNNQFRLGVSYAPRVYDGRIVDHSASLTISKSF